MSHEQSITLQVDDKWYNIPSVVNGKKVSQRKALDFAIENNKLGKGFKTVEKAVEAAKARSKSFDSKPTPARTKKKK